MQKLTLVLLMVVSLVLSTRAFSAPEYRIGPEDEVRVTVLRHAEFSGEFFVPQDGTVDLPGLGPVRVSGMTLQELSDHITRTLSDRLRSPEVSVTLKMQGMQRVYVLGSVRLPGVYDYKPGWRLAECVAAAGGHLGQASDCQARLVKAAGGEQKMVKLQDVLSASPDANLAVDPGDVLSIESVRTLPVYVTGTVKTPGMYQLREGGGILEALTLAGGPLANAALSAVTVTHLSGTKETVNLVPLMQDGSSSANPKLDPGDLVVVPESNKKMAVLGNVARPGAFSMRDGEQVRLADALAMAGGTTKQSNLQSVLVISMQDGKENRKAYNLSSFLKTGEIAANPVIEPGNVVFVGKDKGANWPSIASSLYLVTLMQNVLTD